MAKYVNLGSPLGKVYSSLRLSGVDAAMRVALSINPNVDKDWLRDRFVKAQGVLNAPD